MRAHRGLNWILLQFRDGPPVQFQQRKYRFEIKYRIAEERADEIRAWIHRVGHLQADEYGEGGSAAYNVHSLYLDTPGWGIYKETRAGLQHRYKLRARCYDWTPNAKVFLEVKHRAEEYMWKTRALVTKPDAVRILNNEVPREAKDSPELENFRGLMDKRGAYPRVWVTYRRHAYLGGVRDLVRVTFDTRIRAALPTLDMNEPEKWYVIPESAGLEILELKYSGSYPAWVAELVRRFDLERKAFSKFRYGIDLLNDPDGPVARDKKLKQALEGAAP